MSKKDAIQVAISLGEGIIVQAKGQPAQVVGIGAAVGVAVIAGAVAYGAYAGVGAAVKKLRARKLKAPLEDLKDVALEIDAVA